MEVSSPSAACAAKFDIHFYLHVQKPRDVEMEKVGKGGGTLCREKLRPPASTTRSLGTSAVSTLHNAEYSRPMITHIYQYRIT
jgi:hypothetical protein